MTAIGLISDVHATPAPVEEALSIFRQAGVNEIFCAGDIAGYRQRLHETVALLIGNACLTVVGNHDLLYMDSNKNALDNEIMRFFMHLPTSINLSLAGKQIYMVHAQPPDACHGGIKLLNRNGLLQNDRIAYWKNALRPFDKDVLIVGHTHQIFAEKIGNTLVVNPGSSAFNHSCAILYLPEMTVRFFPLSGKKIKKTWNWGDDVISKDGIAGTGSGNK